MINIVAERSWSEQDGLGTFIMNGSDNGTIFHRPLFLQYHDKNKFPKADPVQFSFYKNNIRVAFITGALQHDSGQTTFISPFASSYGGVVYDSKLSFKELEEILDLLLTHLQKECSCIRLTTTPSFQSKNGKSGYLDFILLSKGFSIVKSDIVLVHQLGPEDKLMPRIDKKTATELKQPLDKNPLRLEIIAGVDKPSYNLLVQSKERLQSSPTHTYDELLRIENLLPGTIQTFKAYSGDDFLAGIITFGVNKTILNTFYIFDKFEARAFKANHFNYFHVLKNAFENNYRYLDFGPTSFGWQPNYPLIDFKEKFDAKPFLRQHFEKRLS